MCCFAAVAAGVGGGWAFARWVAGPPADMAVASPAGGVGAQHVPPAPRSPSPVALRSAVLTSDGQDRYAVAAKQDGRTAVVSAPPTNRGGNLRAVVWDDGEPVTADQESCATFDAEHHDQQPGVALRIRSTGGRTQAITVTKNVWFWSFWEFNVHVMDSGAAEPFRKIGSVDFSPALRLPDGSARPYPWRLCARVEGATVRLVAWPAGEPRPAWDDPARAGAVMLPDGWDAAGRPGVYVGHLPPGESIACVDITTRPR